MSVRVAVEGCGHGTLNAIYSSIDQACQVKGWPGVDLLIIGGDFQAVRNSYDLNGMAVPNKYKAIGDFHEYYSGARKAPYLTIFIGGNHEASNHLSELFYGGWVAPNIYYLGAANVVRLGPLRIAGLSGIWKGYSYNKPHFERVPYSRDDVRSVYHTREIDTRKLLCVRSQVDIGLSHDWPRGVEWMGNWKGLFKYKKFLEPDARSGNLGSVAARKALDRLRPYHWFSAHLHCKYAAVVRHDPLPAATSTSAAAASESQPVNQDEIEVSLDDSDTETAGQPVKLAASVELPPVEKASSVPQSLKDQLPASFKQTRISDPVDKAPVPSQIQNMTTNFLALSKCLANQQFLQLLELEGKTGDQESSRPYHLAYDKEWLALTRAFDREIASSTAGAQPTKDKGYGHYASAIDKELEWVEANVVKTDLLPIPENFQAIAPTYDPKVSIHTDQPPKFYPNPQTETFCKMIQIETPFSAS